MKIKEKYWKVKNNTFWRMKKMEKTLDLNPKEDISSTKQKKNSICVQEISTIVSFAADSKGNILQVPYLKVEKKSLMQLERFKWRPI